MTKNPIYNASVAMLYIVGIASLLFYAPHFENNIPMVIVPIVMLSLFVLSAAIMGYVFCYQPIRLFLEDEKTAAVHLFLRTIGFFALFTFLILGVLFFL